MEFREETKTARYAFIKIIKIRGVKPGRTHAYRSEVV